jgi:hypothetical protein
MVIVIILYFVHQAINRIWNSAALNYTSATLFLLLFSLFIYRVERKEFDTLFKIRRN